MMRRAELLGTAGASETLAAPGRRYLPALDGLRGTAILAVLICHYSALLPTRAHLLAGVLENGWAGVDLFFVISGFLITGILFDAKGTTPDYFRNFYARRFLRIFPLYYGLLAVLLAILLVLRSHSNQSVQLLWRAQPWLWTYTANYWIPTQTDWPGWSEIIIPLWSLSVEEQFYLVWPLVVFAFSHRALMRICVGILIGALALRLLLTASGVGYFSIYAWTPTRADSLAAGALLALLIRLPNGEWRARRLAKYAGAAAALILLVVGSGLDPIHHPWRRDLLYSALAILFAAILFWSIDVASLFGIPKRFYELRVLRTIGGYSYGIYILHLPLMDLTSGAARRWGWYDPDQAGWIAASAIIAVNVALTGAAAFASFHLYEKQFLKLKRYFPEPARPTMR